MLLLFCMIDLMIVVVVLYVAAIASDCFMVVLLKPSPVFAK